MGFLNKLFGAKAPEEPIEPPGPVPAFDYELKWVRGQDAVEKALSLREEWKGAFTPIIVGTLREFDILTNTWDEPGPSAEEFLDSAEKLDLARWFELRKNHFGYDREYLEELTKSSEW